MDFGFERSEVLLQFLKGVGEEYAILVCPQGWKMGIQRKWKSLFFH
jgi:hypothetical protein